MVSKRLSLGLALAAAGLLAAYFIPASRPEPPANATRTSAPAQVTTLPQPITRQAADTASVASPARSITAVSATQKIANPLERSEDLRASYDQLKDSSDALERHAAYRAWSACFPTFIAPQGQPVSIDSLTRALPLNDPATAFRVDAYRSLQARCRNFFDLSRDELLSATRQQQEASYRGSLLSPGELATRRMSDGHLEEALKLARDIIASRDPFAIGSLREFVQLYLVLKVDAQMAPGAERPDLRALAFTLAACQLGLECGPASLTALQLCASMGECTGGVADRYLHALTDAADRDATQAEARRVVEAIQSGNFEALGW